MDRITTSEVLDSGSIPDRHTIIRTEFNFNLPAIRDEVNFFINKYPNLNQIGLTHTADAKSEHERVYESTGTATYNSRKQDTEFVIFNQDFKGTTLHTCFEALSEKYRLCRYRIMIMSGPSTYYAHSDISPRLHYAVETNIDCMFLFPEIKEQHHIPQDGHVYYVDTRHRHTFVNASRLRRIHLLWSLFPE